MSSKSSPAKPRRAPAHMRESSDEEPLESELSSTETDLTELDINDDEPTRDAELKNAKKRANVMERLLKRKATVGQVQLDPEIDYTDFTKDGPGLSSRASMNDDGMINIWVDLKEKMPDLHKDYAREVQEFATDPRGGTDCPPLSIVIFIVGSRGDVQPYLSLALHLVRSHGHRVRIATHPDFKDFVLGANQRLKGQKGKKGQELEGHIEFFDIGGDPKALMAYMVKNPGLLPGWEALKSGDIQQKRRMTADMLQGFFKSIYSPDPTSLKPFAADAIISNPPAFAHCHLAEAFGLPLHMTFTMPWSPSEAFNHPLVNIKQSNAEKGITNVLTFSFAEMMTWQGLGDIINAFRGLTLGLEPLTLRNGPAILDRLKVPWTYCWSQGLIPKPDDWKGHIDISGFYFMEGDSDFKPDDELAEFLKKGDPPIYIGFGSVVVEDAVAMTKTIFEAVKQAGVRALISAGWGGLGGQDVPEEVFVLEGAGTTAIGLRNGLPTIVVPFFGDQKFWGDMIHRAGAGPEPIPQKQLSAEKLAAAIKYAVSDQAKKAAGIMGEKIRAEDGEQKGVESFHKHLPLQTMRCDLQPDRAAHWWSPTLFLRLSGAAAMVLQDAGKLAMDDLEPLRAKEYQARYRSADPASTSGPTDLLFAISDHFGGKAQKTFTDTIMPQGVVDVLSGVHSGIDAIPGRLGSNVRERGKIDGLVSGVREAGKGLAYGWWDGITGLATEPVYGAKKEGPLGFIKGMGRSYVNVVARPAAGIAGTVALPLHGAYLSMRQKVAGTPQRLIREPRAALAHLDASSLSKDEKDKIKQAFATAEKKTEERKGYYKRKAEVFLENMKKEEEALHKQGPGQGQGQGHGEVRYVQEGELRPVSQDELDRMTDEERAGYERAKKQFEQDKARDE